MVVGDWGDVENLCHNNRGRWRLIKKEWWLTVATAMMGEGGGWWNTHQRFTLQQKVQHFLYFSSLFFIFTSFIFLLWLPLSFKRFFLLAFLAHQQSSITLLQKFPLKSIIFSFLFFILSQFLICIVCKWSFNKAHSGAKQHPTSNIPWR